MHSADENVKTFPSALGSNRKLKVGDCVTVHGAVM